MTKECHDSYDDNHYEKKCVCVKCEKTFGEWCDKKKRDGCTKCKVKRVVIEEIRCEQPVTTIHEWGYKKQYKSKWESIDECKVERIRRDKHDKHDDHDRKRDRKDRDCKDKKEHKKRHNSFSRDY